MGSSDSFVEVIGGCFFVVDDSSMPQQHTCGTYEAQGAGPGTPQIRHDVKQTIVRKPDPLWVSISRPSVASSELEFT